MSAPHQALLMIGGVNWNPLDKSSAITLSNNNRTATVTIGIGTVHGTTGHAGSGKYYFEVLATTVDTANNNPNVGVATIASGTVGNLNHAGAWAIQSSPQFFWHNGSAVASGVSYGNGDIYQVAVDLSTNKIWFGKNNTWILSGDPATGANAAATDLAGTLYPALSVSTGANTTANFALADFIYTPPTGFLPW